MTRIVIQTGTSAPVTLDIEDTGDNAPVHLHLPAAPNLPAGQPKEEAAKWRVWRRPAVVAALTVIAVFAVMRVTAPPSSQEPPPPPFARLPPIPGHGPEILQRQTEAPRTTDDRQVLLDALKQPAHVEPPPGVPGNALATAPSATNAFGLEN
ncbi:hypothetical protein [Acetobacter conturbans]|uniref:Uncharacterized protein n=1 Tax=Acetobacter conturbans TaxID=1737472 RepID=A0ABX0K2Q8_9PROT|nr:hypothetical protein [Acetobacter conturbans]NHN89981.1 hypothetical protein [Acetobacter conturbans]